ncbi:MAG TPA: protein phosphatase 2C domain-containing protein [Candidatus Binatia bacterium]|nr:protein phosphatase 2C domain-containing protein [Candidatus Binatia bacterium]
MALRWQAQSVPKAGHGRDENEDQFSVADFEAGSRLRAAVADGATESVFSREWAWALVQAWLERPEVDERMLARASQAWVEAMPPREALPWYALARLEDGSHAAAAFLEVWLDGDTVRWVAGVAGDCLVLVRRGRHRRTVPFPPPRFDSMPSLLGTTPPWDLESVQVARGRSKRLVEIWIATDALAAAFLRQGRRLVWDHWRLALESQETFERLVASWRSDGRLRNDDATLVRIWLE